MTRNRLKKTSPTGARSDDHTQLLKRHPATTTKLDVDDVDIEVRTAGPMANSQILVFRIEPVNMIMVR
jgi:hypothetical protein